MGNKSATGLMGNSNTYTRIMGGSDKTATRLMSNIQTEIIKTISKDPTKLTKDNFFDKIKKLKYDEQQDLFQWLNQNYNDKHFRFLIGRCFYEGIGVMQNDSYAKATLFASLDMGFEYVFHYLNNNFIWPKKQTTCDEKIKIYTFLAREGRSLAKHNLGVMYFNLSKIESAVEKNQYLSESHKWFLEAATEKCVDSYYNVALNYYIGTGVEKDLNHALTWAILATENKIISSYYLIGSIYISEFKGKDLKLAKKWFEIGADLINSDNDKSEAIRSISSRCIYTLGQMYFKSIGVEKDEKKGFELVKKASEMNLPDAMYLYGSFYFEGMIVEQNYSEAKNIFEKGATLNNINCIIQLGNMYTFGLGLQKDLSEAHKWYNLAIEKGSKHVFAYIGEVYELSGDYVNAVKWFEKGINECKDTGCMEKMGNFYMRGTHYAQNIVMALELYQKSADLGNNTAYYFMGKIYEIGILCEKNYKLAMEYYMKNLENHNTLFSIAGMYSCGYGVDKDQKVAIEWYKKSEKLGNYNAMVIIAEHYEKSGELKLALKYYTVAYQKIVDSNGLRYYTNDFKTIDNADIKNNCKSKIATLMPQCSLEIMEELILKTNQNEKLAIENERMSTELLYGIEGDGYKSAKSHFEKNQ